MNTSNTFFSWNTNTKGGMFIAVVTKNTSRAEPNSEGRYCDVEVVKTAAFSTRAKAVGFAKKLVRYYNATA